MKEFQPYQDGPMPALGPTLDASTFKEIFFEYYNSLYAAAFAYTKSHEESEDIVQQAFLKLWVKRDTVKPTDLKGYLFITAKNIILNRFHHLIVSRKHLKIIKASFEVDTFTPENYSINRQRGQFLENAIKNLSPRQEQAYRLSRQQGLTHEQIATCMGISKLTVKNHIAKSIAHITTYMKNTYLSLLPLALVLLS
ncbi:sigma-70 family RNA polymerase sigma factor [Chitinophaga sp. CC14]|uniref:RNA polymerase sigma factor n=1 Tax=Chitinophaga sp. CC14 TaxID=3029199 RepID=UPI003B7902FC